MTIKMTAIPFIPFILVYLQIVIAATVSADMNNVEPCRTLNRLSRLWYIIILSINSTLGVMALVIYSKVVFYLLRKNQVNQDGNVSVDPRARRASRMVVYMVLWYYTAYVPILIEGTLEEDLLADKPLYRQIISLFTITLYYSNTYMSPIIYANANREFMKAYKIVLGL